MNNPILPDRSVSAGGALRLVYSRGEAAGEAAVRRTARAPVVPDSSSAQGGELLPRLDEQAATRLPLQAGGAASSSPVLACVLDAAPEACEAAIRAVETAALASRRLVSERDVRSQARGRLDVEHGERVFRRVSVSPVDVGRVGRAPLRESRGSRHAGGAVARDVWRDDTVRVGSVAQYGRGLRVALIAEQWLGRLGRRVR